MPSGRDDDALMWDGDDDPTLDVGSGEPADAVPATGATTPLPDGWSAVGKGSEMLPAGGEAEAEAEVSDPHGSMESGPQGPPEREAMGNAELITLGVLGGFSVLYAVGWLIGGLRLQGQLTYLVTDVMYQAALWLAVLAPVVWFGTVLLLTARSKKWIRFVWLVGGVVFLIPWPFIMIGVIGQ